MIYFTRKKKKPQELPLTAMIDVVFILIFFFMLTTNFMRVESMEIKLPSAKGATAASKSIARIVLYDEGNITFGERTTDIQGLEETLKALLKANPSQQLIVYADEKVNLNRLVEVMDMISVLGGKSVYVRPLPKSVTPKVDAAE